MDDKTRILSSLVADLVSSMIMCGYRPKPGSFDVGPAIGDVRTGDLVVCATSGSHDWTVAFVHEVYSQHEVMLREIGTDRLCRMGNERFYPIINLRPDDLLEKDQRQFYEKLRKAFRRYGDDWHLYAGLRFEGKTVHVSVRERYGGFVLDKESVPYILSFSWNKRISVKRIAQTMREMGWMEREFERRERKPPADTEEGRRLDNMTRHPITQNCDQNHAQEPATDSCLGSTGNSTGTS